MRYVTGLFRYLWIFVLIPALVYVVVWVLPRSNPEQFKATVSRWSRRLLKGMGVSVKHTGRITPPQTGQGLLILSNHCSFIDIFAVDTGCVVVDFEEFNDSLSELQGLFDGAGDASFYIGAQNEAVDD